MIGQVTRWLLVVCTILGVLPLWADQRPAEELDGFPDVWLLNTPGSGLVTLRLEFEGGSALDPAESEGLTALAILALSSEMKPLPGSGIRFRTGSAYAMLTMQVLAEDLPELLGHVQPLVLDPTFSDQTFSRVKQQIQSFLRSNSEDHYTYSKEEWLRVFHGTGPIYGTPASVDALTYKDSLAAATMQLRDQNLTASVVGDLSSPHALPALRAFFAALYASNRNVTRIAASEYKAPEDIAIRDSQSRETSIVFGAAPENTESNYFVGTIVAQLFGGSISRSRLGRRVRFEGGLAYIVEANHIDRGLKPVMMGYVGTSPKNAKHVVELIREEWQRLGREGVTEEELQAATDYLSGGAALMGDDSMRLAEQMQRARRLGLGPDFATEWPTQFEKVDLESVNSAVSKFAEPGSLKILVLGSLD